MRTTLLLLIIIGFSCRSPKRFQTYRYADLAPKHKTIAIVPIVLEGQTQKENQADSTFTNLLKKENNFIQNALYQRISYDSGNGKKDIKISILPIQKTNKILADAGITYANIQDTPTETLEALLHVDAILRTKINTSIFLHSTKYDIPKEILSTSTVYIKNPIFNRFVHFDAVPVFLSAEIQDSKTQETIWALANKRTLEIHDKNTDLAAWLCKDIAKNFPYRDK